MSLVFREMRETRLPINSFGPQGAAGRDLATNERDASKGLPSALIRLVVHGCAGASSWLPVRELTRDRAGAASSPLGPDQANYRTESPGRRLWLAASSM
jgi:hypothetical protein